MNLNTQPNRFQSRIRKGTAKLAGWTAAWLVSEAALALGPKFVWNDAAPITLAAFAVCILVGVGMIFANKNLLRDQDELQKKVQFDAMAITLGVLIVTGAPYYLLEAYELAPFKAGFPQLMVLMSLTFLISILVGMRRYR